MPEARQKVTGWVVVKAVDAASRRIGGYFSTRYTDREGEEFAPEFFAKSMRPAATTTTRSFSTATTRAG